MVKIEDIKELKNIKESNYGFVIITTNTKAVIHNTDCKLIFEQDFLKEGNKNSTYHWFSTYSLAEKKIGDIKPCKLCNP